MSTHRNPRPDAKLKRLPDPLKDEILRRCGLPEVTQASILKWLADECAVESSPAALSDFCSWWPARKRALTRESMALAHMEVIREQHPDWSESEVFAEGQKKFAIQAIADDDPKAWSVVNTSRENRERTELEKTKTEQRARLIALKTEEVAVKKHLAELAERRVVLLESKLAQVNAALAEAKKTGGITPETLAKIEEAAKIL
jgi:hypothetical protein